MSRTVGHFSPVVFPALNLLLLYLSLAQVSDPLYAATPHFLDYRRRLPSPLQAGRSYPMKASKRGDKELESTAISFPCRPPPGGHSLPLCHNPH